MDAYPHLNDLYLSPRLQARLADAAGYPVTTIVAPTGYGKTTAAQYLQRRIAAEAPDARVFRQFLSGGGRQEFWAGLCRTLRVVPQLSAQLLALGYPDSPHTRQQLLELVQDALAGKPPVWFILTTCTCFPAARRRSSSRFWPSASRRRCICSCSRAIRFFLRRRSCASAAACWSSARRSCG